MQDTVHVAVLLGKQPFQEANVATPSCDEQCNVGRLLSSLQREGVSWGEGIVCCVEAKNGGMNGIYLGSWA